MKNKKFMSCLYTIGNQWNSLSLEVVIGDTIHEISLCNRIHIDGLASNHELQLMRVPTRSSVHDHACKRAKCICRNLARQTNHKLTCEKVSLL